MSGLRTRALASSTRRFMPAESAATSASGFEGHARDDRLDLLVHPPAAVDFQGVLDAVEPGVQLVAPFDGQSVGQMVILGQQFRPRAQSAGDLVEDRAAQVPAALPAAAWR